MAPMASPALHLIRCPQIASNLLQPARLRLLQLLERPDSASGLARQLDLPRQQVNYHLRELENDGLVELVEERRKGNCMERVVRATARAYLVCPQALGKLSPEPEKTADRFSVSCLIALAASAVKDLTTLAAGARKANKRLATLSLQSEIRFASAADRNAFAEELANNIARLVAKYHHETAEGGRRFRLIAGVYPAVKETEAAPESESVTVE